MVRLSHQIIDENLGGASYKTSISEKIKGIINKIKHKMLSVI